MAGGKYSTIDPDVLVTRDLRKLIDFTLLKPEVDREGYVDFLQTAAEHGFGSVFVPPCYVPLAIEMLAGEGIAVGTPISFPFGYSQTGVKVKEAIAALENGALELDVVMNISFARSGLWEKVEEDLAQVVEAVRRWEGERGTESIILKTILETPYLDGEQTISACRCTENAGMDFVKTATGLGVGGATVEAVRTMKGAVGDRLGVKAAGGIRSWDGVESMLTAGAIRIGTSTATQIIGEFERACSEKRE